MICVGDTIPNMVNVTLVKWEMSFEGWFGDVSIHYHDIQYPEDVRVSIPLLRGGT